MGTVTIGQPCLPNSDDPLDIAAAERWDAVWNRVTLDGVLKGSIPTLLAEAMTGIVKPGDEKLIKFPIHMLGINFYSPNTMKHEPGRPFDVGWGQSKADRWTGMPWPVQPEGLYDLLMSIKRDYNNQAVYIAENGAAYDDVVGPDGVVHDKERVRYFADHLRSVERAIADGCNVKGYMCWSLLDNFEWSFGLTKRFGIVRVDYDTLKRTPKDSYHFLSQIAKTGVIPATA